MMKLAWVQVVQAVAEVQVAQLLGQFLQLSASILSVDVKLKQ